MKILFAIKDLNNSKGGAERVLAIVASGLANAGHDVTILTYDKLGGQSYYPLDPKVQRLSLGIGHSQQNASFNETVGRVRALRRVLTVRKPDVVVPFMHSMFIPMSLAAVGTGVPVIASEHIVPTHYKTRPLQFLLLLISSLLIDELTVLSPTVRRSYPWLIRRKMVVMPNPVEAPTGARKKSDADKRILLNVGRLDEQKDQKTLIRAFANLAQDFPDWNVKIFGEGPLKGFLKKLIKKHMLEDRVLLMGTTPNIGKEYLNADIFVMPSKYESFGLATAEAMSYGLPSIGFLECPGTNELIKHQKNGLLVSKHKKDRIVELEEAMRLLMSNEDMRQMLGVNAVSEINRYHPEIIVKQWEHVLEKYA